MVDVNRNLTRKSRMPEHVDDNFVSGTMADRIRLVWPLTVEITALSQRHDAEPNNTDVHA